MPDHNQHDEDNLLDLYVTIPSSPVSRFVSPVTVGQLASPRDNHQPVINGES